MSAAIVVAFEYLMHVPSEVDLFWRQRWTLAKCLFLWSRYYSLVYNIANAAVFLQPNASDDLCTKYFHWENCGAILQYMTTQIILCLRLYAMYERSRKILVFLVVFLVCELAALAFFFEAPKAGLVVTNNPAPGLFICADADPPHVHWIAYVPLIVLVTESVFLGLALYKVWQQRSSKIPGGQILSCLTRQSIFFFSAIFGIHVANLVIWMINTLTVNELITGYSFAIPAVLANRLVLSVRQEVGFPTTDQTTDISDHSIDFRRRVSGLTTMDGRSSDRFDLPAPGEDGRLRISLD